MGGTPCTSLGAFAWFYERLSAGVGIATQTQVATAGNQAAQRAERELDRIGI